MPVIPIEELKTGTGGGKAAGLAKLSRLGLRVPPALVIPDADPRSVPGDIERRWTALHGGPAAVRSSGADEDAGEASAAGQYETLLNVAPAALPDAVAKCAQSAEDERVRTYEQQLSGAGGSGMSVVVQAMVEPSRAGVVFTADPLGVEQDAMIVEAVAGLGENLVSGHAEAARYVLNNPPAGGRDGLVRQSAGALESASMDERTLEEIRAGAALAAAEWGMPLDLEWAVAEESGELYWLQARPITALADSLDSEVGPEDIITRCNIGEMMPGAVTPLTLSTFGKSLNSGLAMYLRTYGALRRREPDPAFIASFEDQLFMNLSSMYLMSRRVMGATAEGTELSILGFVLPPHDIGTKAPWYVRFVNGIRYFGVLFSWKKKIRALRKLAENGAIETDGLSAAEILARFRNAHPVIMDRAVGLHYAASAFSGAMNAALAMTLSGGSAEITDEAKRLMTELLAGVEGVESAAVLEGLENLGNLIRSQGAEGLMDFGSSSAAEIHETLLGDDSEVGEAYRTFMDRHGHRCIREAELREPEWALNPAHLIDSLKALLASPQRRTSASGFNPAAAGKKPGDIAVPEGVNPKAVAWIAKQARTGVRAREESKSLLILAIHRFKVAARTLAGKLEEEGFLPEADLAYFLTMEELGDLVEGRRTGLIGRARRRRRLLPERMELRFPDISRGKPSPEPPRIPEDGSLLTGTPVSRGVAEGTVRIVKTREDAESLESGDIMVAQFTDIGWTPFYGRVSGMITEIGGALSHGSVVAREYGLPLVGGLSGACNFFDNGDKVRIDGGTGHVVLLEKKKAAAPPSPAN